MVNSAVLLSRLRVGATPCSTVILPMTLSPFMMEIAALAQLLGVLFDFDRRPNPRQDGRAPRPAGFRHGFEILFQLAEDQKPACMVCRRLSRQRFHIQKASGHPAIQTELNLTAGFGVSSSEPCAAE
ncbi:MAG: hypothetical protein ACLUFW_10860 [Alistipes sp.]